MSRMSLDTAIRLSAEVKGSANITKVQRSLQDLAKGSQTTARDMDALRTATAQYARASEGSIAGLRNSIVAFRGLQEQAKIGSREFTRYGAEVQRLERNLRGLEGTARKASPALNGLGAAAGRLLAAYAGIETVRFVFGNTAEIEAQTRSLEVLTGSADRAKQIVQELQQLGAVTPFTSTELIDTAKRLQAFGVETENVVDITRRLADVSGATGAELAGLATAYGQVQAKGRLQGEELLQFQERGVALQQVLRKEYGLSAAEFQKSLEGGKISAEAVEFALRKLTDSGGKYANGAIAQSDTLNGRLSTLQDSIQMLAQTVGRKLEPEFKKVLNVAISLTGQLQQMVSLMDNLGGQRRELDWQREADLATDRFAKQAGWNPLVEQGKRYEFRQLYMAQKRADYDLSQQSARATNAAPPSTAPPPLSGGGGAASGGAAAGAGGGGAARQQSAEDRIAAMPFGREIIAAAKANSIDPALFAALVAQESGFNPTARGRRADGSFSGAFGLAQLKPDTAREVGVNINDPRENLLGGARYLRQQIDRFGLEGGLRAYNQGPGAQQRTPGGNSQESREYSGKVLARARRFGFDGDGSAEDMEAIGRGIDSRKAMQDQQKAAAELLATEDNRLKLLQIADPLQKQIAESVIKQLTIQDKYGKRLAESRSPEETRSLELAQQNALQSNSLELERSINDLREDSLKPLSDIVREHGDRLAYEREYGGLLATGINPELAKQFMEIDRIAQASKISLETQIARLEVMAAELPVDDKLRKSLEDQVKLKRELLGLIPVQAAEAKDDATETAEVVANRERQKADAERLKDLYKSIGSTLEEGLIGAIQTGIDGLIDGTQRLDESLKEILSGVLRDIANQLLRFAVNTALKSTGLPIFADGGVFGGGSITPFANGGVVNEPTMFKFSQGGAMQNGLLGEAGPEAILPLRRGPDGRLGVDASGMAVPFQATPAAAPNDLAVPFMRSGNSSPAAMAAEAARAMASTPLEPIKLQVESRVINGVEYVTTSQLREATEAAAMAGRDSAYEGMRNNPSIQRSLGMR
jgi:tape measure domain-containing protein